MRIFNKDGHLNFVDRNNVVVGFEYHAQCCERFGYWFSTIEKGEEDINEDAFDFEDFVFDKGYHEYYGDSVRFKLTRVDETCESTLFLTLYNEHNGYYTHGFHFLDGGKTITGGSI